MDSGFRVLDSGLFQSYLDSRISIVSGIPCIPDSKAQDSGFLTWGDLVFDSKLHGELYLECEAETAQDVPLAKVLLKEAYSLTIELIRDKTLQQNNKFNII